MNRQQKTISVPRGLVESMADAYQKWEEFSDEFEDFVLASDEHFFSKMRKAREEHQKGNLRNLSSLKREL